MSTTQDEVRPNNLLMFKAALSNTFQGISKCVSEKEFQDAFSMLKLKPSKIKKLYQAMEEDFLQEMNNELQELVNDECLVHGMKIVSKLQEETQYPPDTQLWRPPGDVNLHMRSLDAEKIKNECAKLEDYITKTTEENKGLEKMISKRRKQSLTIGNKMKEFLKTKNLLQLEGTDEFNRDCTKRLYNDV